MTRTGAIFLILAAVTGALALGGANGPSALAGVKGGIWELEGVPGTHAPARACFADIQLLTRYEHRANRCTAKSISDDGQSTIVEYSCGPAGFGRTKVDAITPRNLRISTQGISQQLPFNYTLNAHRIGDCEK